MLELIIIINRNLNLSLTKVKLIIQKKIHHTSVLPVMW